VKGFNNAMNVPGDEEVHTILKNLSDSKNRIRDKHNQLPLEL
jgi:hypothetical protein